MIRIRLARVGKKSHPSYRIVVAEIKAPRDGSYLEWIGNYDPMADPPAVTLKEDRAAHWLSMGARPSDAVSRILANNGLMERTQTFKTGVKKNGEAPAAAPRAAAPAAAAPTAVAEAPAEEAPVDEAPVEQAPEEAPAAEEEASGEEKPAE
ncbi:MAG: 30S ribosomal protein S16 [Chloroflexi bacterium]|nr:30S ribosomal protein S16 [Chloroflexota bacterium]MDA1270369.1 30S ribosomal protein S16 [Chloroflexota bacterium]